MAVIAQTSGLTKVFGSQKVVDDLGITIHKGDIYGFIGKNGAGKTTTMKMLLGTLRPTRGSIQLFGSDRLTEGRAKIGSLIEDPGLYRSCTAEENMRRFTTLFGGDPSKIGELLTIVGLQNTGKKKVKGFSLGMKQRLGIAVAMIADPEFLVLDEPINGLDPTGIREVRDLIVKLNQERGVTMMISSHLLDELSKIATRYGIINKGALVEEITAEELNHRCRQALKIVVSDPSKAAGVVNTSFAEMSCTIENDAILIHSDLDGRQRAELNRVLANADIAVSEISFNNNSVEDYFLERIGDKS